MVYYVIVLSACMHSLPHTVHTACLTSSGKFLVCNSSLFETPTDCKYNPSFGISSAGHLELLPFYKDNNYDFANY